MKEIMGDYQGRGKHLSLLKVSHLCASGASGERHVQVSFNLVSATE